MLTRFPVRQFGARGLLLGLLGLAACGQEGPASRLALDVDVLSEFAQMSLEEVLAIPASPGAAEPNFHRIGGGALSRSGEEIYVVDRYGPSVRVFDRDGALLREFGRAGEGPGEFRSPYGLRLVGEEVRVRDTRLLRFTREGRPAGMRHRELSRLEEGGAFQRRPMAIVRYDQVLSIAEMSSGLDPAARSVVLLDAEDREVEVLFRDMIGSARVRLRSRPELLSSTVGFPAFGTEMSWEASGDSVLVRADNFTGRVEWHRIERGHLRPIQSHDLELPPVPVPVSEDEVVRHETERRGLPASEILEVSLPRYQAYFNGAYIDSNLDVWLRWVNYDPPGGEAAGTRMVRVPFDRASPVGTVELPPELVLLAAEGELLLSRHTDPDSGVQSLRLHRVRP